ncbi:hypothetical protein NW755_008878 [Fusarium falciforme]|uniref:Uncharacterized protein n=1 Tax=Fusarium falciforme TaxID=195108 RepID=A0A9W8R2B6_9HYPO|nr:hypothetical protein NW755_008878 [Fusarium falciforme]
MAPPRPYMYNYGDGPQSAPPPPYGYYPPYQTHVVVTPPRQDRRRSCVRFVVSTARQFSLIIPFVIVILSIWWSFRYQAIASAIWSIAMIISARRALHHMSHVPMPVNAAVQLILAIGATVCFALLVYHMETYDYWTRYTEGGMAALLAMLFIVNWILFVWTLKEIKEDQQRRQHANSHIPI